MKRKLLVKKLTHWHRRVGALIAFLVVFVALSGIAINHSHDLGWDKRQLQWPWLLSIYGVSMPQPDSGFKVNDHWLSALNGRLYWNERDLFACGGYLQGAIALDQIVVALCDTQAILLTSTGQVIEPLAPPPQSIIQVGAFQQQILAANQEQGFLLDVDSGSWEGITLPESGVIWSKKAPLPASIKLALNSQRQPSGITWERVLLDLHSGRLFGAFGVYMADLVALLLVVSALSGWWLWYRRLHTKPKFKH